MQYIFDLDGKPIEVTDLPKALEQAETYVKWHEERKAEKEKDSSVFYFKKGHEHWSNILQQLKELSK